MLERSGFHFNEAYLFARAEINQISVKKRDSMHAVWTQACPAERNYRKGTWGFSRMEHETQQAPGLPMP